MRIANLLRVILAVFTATLLMTFVVYTVVMCAAPMIGMPTKKITNSPFAAQIEQMWVPDRTLNFQPIKIANYSLEARLPLNKEWKQIKRVKP